MKRVLALAASGLALWATAAEAHLGNANYLDTIDRVMPADRSLSVEVLNFDNNLEIDNRTGKPVVIYGYTGDVYARLLGDGTVQVNQRSPAYYLNDDRYATTAVPASANPKAPAKWVTLDKTGRFEWHDHRIHLFTTATPKAVTDRSKRTKIFAWSVPISVGGQAGTIAGTLFWRGQSSGFPIWAPISILAIVLAGGVVVVRARRRQPAGVGDGEAPAGDRAAPAGADDFGTGARPEAW
jgi:hypothetical protein